MRRARMSLRLATRARALPHRALRSSFVGAHVADDATPLAPAGAHDLGIDA